MSKIKLNKNRKSAFSLILILSFIHISFGQDEKPTGNSQAAPKVPIILIHGIGGSNLRQPDSRRREKFSEKGMRQAGGFPREVLKDLLFVKIGKPENIEFDRSGNPRTDTLSKTAIADGFYDIPGKNITDLSAYLKKQLKQTDKNNPVYDFAYDFRFSAMDNAVKLGASIDELKKISGAGQVDIVGHSMGGLIAKAYLTTESNAASVRNVIFVGTPHLGAPKALKALRYGDDLQVALIDECKLKRAARNYPGMYNLLPGKRYFEAQKARTEKEGYFYDEDDLDNDQIRGLLDYEQTLNNLKNGVENKNLCPMNPKDDVMKGDEAVELDKLNANLIDRYTVEFHDSLDNWKKPAGVTVYNIVGFGVETLARIKQTGGKVYLEETTEGDGTVPLWSAEAVESDYVYYINLGKLKLEHSIMIGDQNFGVQIYELLTKGKSAAIPETLDSRPTNERFTTKTKSFEIKEVVPTNQTPRRKKP